jgi:hypothetical protein
MSFSTWMIYSPQMTKLLSLEMYWLRGRETRSSSYPRLTPIKKVKILTQMPLLLLHHQILFHFHHLIKPNHMIHPMNRVQDDLTASDQLQEPISGCTKVSHSMQMSHKWTNQIIMLMT